MPALAPKKDPWAEFADPVDLAPPVAAAPEAQPANDEFAAVSEPARLTNTERTVAEGFDTPPPEGVAHRMAPEDEQELTRIVAEEPLDVAASKARQFLASKGFSPGPATVEGFEGDSLDQAVETRRRTGTVASNLEYLRPQPTNYEGGVSDATVRGFGDIATSGFLDEIGGVVDSLGAPDFDGPRENVFTSDRPFGDIVASNIDINRGIVERDEEEHPYARVTGQLLGGLAIPMGYETVGFTAGREAMVAAHAAGSTTKEALTIGRKAAAAAVRNAIIRDSTILGGAHGVGTGEGVEGRVGEGLLEAGLGAAGGAAVGKVAEAAAPRAAAARAAARAEPLTEEQELMRAADRQNVDVLPADVGGPVTRRATSTISQTIAGGQPVIKAAQRSSDQAQSARDRVATAIGEAMQPEAAGQQAIAGAKSYIKTSADDARVFYNAAEKEAAGERILTPKAIDVLDRNIAELAETPGGAPGLATLQSLRQALDNGRLTVPGVRRMRTILRDQFIKDGLTGSDLERRVNQVVDAAAQDVTDELTDRGNKVAADLFAKGDAAWRKRMQTIDEVIQPIVGKPDQAKSGEAVIKTLTADLQGNNARAVKFLDTLPESERANVRASIIGALGREKAGTQGSEGTNFSLNTFLTHWNLIGETAKRAYFGPEARAALNDLAKIAEGTREAQTYRNMSNTGGVVGNIVTGMAGFGGFVTLAKVVGVQYGLGRLLASPRFARWLARAPKAKNQQAYLSKLGNIARAEPAIASDVLSLQQRLTDAFARPPLRAAATGDTNEDTSQNR